MTNREKQILKSYFDDIAKSCDVTISSFVELKALCIKCSKNLRLGLEFEGDSDKIMKAREQE